MYNELDNILVYVVECSIGSCDQSSTDEEFIAEARKLEGVYELLDFEQAVNDDELVLTNSFIRFFTADQVNKIMGETNPEN